MKRMMVRLFVLFLMIGISAIPSKVHADYSGDINIFSDGSVSPSDAPLSTVDNITYILTENMIGRIFVYRDNITLDGSAHIIKPPVIQEHQLVGGIRADGIKNVIITNCNVGSFNHGMVFLSCSNLTIRGNNLTDNLSGISLLSTNNAVISDNILNFNHDQGIGVGSSNCVSIFNNIFSDCLMCVTLQSCNSSTIEANQIDNCTSGIFLDSSNHITLSQNSFTGDSPNNSSTLYIGIDIESSENNSATENTFTALTTGISMYLANQNNIINNTSTDTGVFLQAIGSSNNTFSENNITNVETGFNLQQFSTNEMTTDNIIVQNTIINSMFNVVLGNASGNLFFHNNFVNSTYGLNIFYPNSTVDSWDNGIEGNYWSDYNGTDDNQDGIGDTPYTLHQFTVFYRNNTDHYPLMGHFESFSVSTWSHPDDGFEEVDVISNFTISDLGLYEWLTTPNQYLQVGQLFLRLVPGQEQNMTAGFCRMTLPNNMLNTSDYIVLTNMNSISVNKLATSNNTHTTLYFTFNTSDNEEIIIVPEFPSFLILPLFFMATLLTIIFCRKKLTRTA